MTMTNKFVINSNFNVVEKQAKDGDENSIIIEGYANTTSKDRVGDVIIQEAWTNGGLDNYMKNPIILAFHDHTKPIGKTTEVSVEAKGLKISAEIFKSAGDIFDSIKNGILQTFSVGFRVKDADYDTDTDIFVIKDLELFEISVVSVPANQDSIFSIKKNFESKEDYEDFKTEFNTGEKRMPELNVEQITDAIAAKLTEKMDKQSDDMVAALELISEKAEADKKEAATLEAERIKKALEAQALIKSQNEGKTGAEDLLADLEKRFNDKEKSFSEALEGLQTDIKEKAAELEALQKNKMSFNEEGKVVSEKEIDEAVFVAKALGRPLETTKLGKILIQKAGAHVTPMTADWESEFSKRIYNEMSDRLILEPLFNTIAMTTPTMEIPINPEAGVADWIGTGSFRGASSTGTAVDHTLTDTTLTAHKLTSKEYIGYEEEEDAIIPIVPIIRAAVVRRMSRSSDIALLRGNTGNDSGNGTNWLFSGLTILGTDSAVNPSIGASDKVTVADLATCRRALGVQGLSPVDVRYIVSSDAYYDLLEDPDFRTMDMVGTQATILTGQIGFAAGSPVVVSDSFEAKAATKPCVVAVNTSPFVVGNLRGMMVERDRNIEEQKNILVASRRFGFLRLSSTDGPGTTYIKWAA